MCRSSAAVKLLASESVNIVEGRGFESRRQLLFFFFFFFFFFFSIFILQISQKSFSAVEYSQILSREAMTPFCLPWRKPNALVSGIIPVIGYIIITIYEVFYKIE